MTNAAEKTLADAMSLEPEERVAFAKTLLERTPHTSDPAYLAAWSSEIYRRLNEFETGPVTGQSWKKCASVCWFIAHRSLL